VKNFSRIFVKFLSVTQAQIIFYTFS